MENSGEQGELQLNYRNCDALSHLEFLPYINIQDANKVKRPCRGTGFNIFDCKNPNIAQCLIDINGLDFDDIKVINSLNLSLVPDFIPIINKDFFGFDSKVIPYDIIGVSLLDIFKDKLTKKYGRYNEPRLILDENLLSQPLFKGKKVILFSTAKDIVLETLWRKIELLDYFSKVKNMGFWAISAVNFSLFKNECPIANPVNLKRSLVTFDKYQNLGIPSIPHVYFLNDLDLDRWILWINQNLGLNLITTNCQLLQIKDHFLYLYGIEKIISQTKGKVKILLEGAQLPFIKKLTHLSSHIIIASKTPASDSIYYWKYFIYSRKLIQVMMHGTNRAILLKNNLITYEEFLISRLKRKSLEKFSELNFSKSIIN